MTTPLPTHRPSAHLAHQKYRPDIDGLRAVAVFAVVGFHAFPHFLKGGFIGVDIFFVISGFLISNIILSSLERGRFSFAEFYGRRIRRIFPALSAVLITSFAFGWFILLADEYKQLGKHVAGSAGFISNFILWQESGYFDNAGTTKPLLHLWSLGVEEQFYLAWPFLLWLAWKKRFNFLATTVAIVIVSFLLNIATYRSDAVGDFYSPQTRFWELLTGSILAYSIQHKGWLSGNSRQLLGILAGKVNSVWHADQNTTQTRTLQSVLGILIIGTGIFAISKEDNFPGYLATVPVAGAASIIAAGPHAWVNRAILSKPLIVWFGLISYPLYLWHWPLLSFANIVEGETPSHSVRIAAVLCSIVLAWATYQAIEKPIRSGKHGKPAAISLLMLMTLIGSLGYGAYEKNGLPDRFFAEQHNKISEAINDWEWPNGLKKIEADGVTLYGNSTQPANLLIVGDSHVMQFSPKVAHASGQRQIPPILIMADIGCPVVPFVFDDAIHQHCRSFVEKFLGLLKKSPDIKKIVIGGCWNCYFIDQTRTKRLKNDPQNFYYQKDGDKVLFRGQDGRRLALASLKELLTELSRGYSVYLLLDNPNGHFFNPRKMLKNRLDIGRNSEGNVMTLPQEQIDLNNELRMIALESGAQVIDQVSSLCPDYRCSRLDKDGRPIYKDENHLRSSFVRENGSPIDAALSP